jgi:hypothetical protein
MNDTLQLINSGECFDCAEKAIAKDWGGFIACSATIVIGAIIRHFEKKKIQRNLRNKL